MMPKCAAVLCKESKSMKGFTSATITVPVKLTELIFLIVISCCGELVLRFGFLNLFILSCFLCVGIGTLSFACAGDILVGDRQGVGRVHAQGEAGWFALGILVQLDDSGFECRVNALQWKSKRHTIPWEEMHSYKDLSAFRCFCPLKSFSS